LFALVLGLAEGAFRRLETASEFADFSGLPS
jgi:hypothetical protein